MTRQLLIDQGNTRVKAAWARDGEIEFIASADNAAALLRSLTDRPDRVWLSSVADPLARTVLLDDIGSRWGCPCNLVSVPAYQSHLPTEYAPAQLGVDRWLALLACRNFERLPCVVVDCGTAITVDLLDHRGVHIGGYILPGLSLMKDSLLRATAIAEVPGDDTVPPPARDTVSAIALGTRLAVVALVETQLAQLGPDAVLYLGGGDAGELSSMLSVRHDMVEQMVLRGLARLSLREDG